MPCASYQCSSTASKISILESDGPDALPFPPAAATIGFSKERARLDARAGRDRFDSLDFTDDFEFHCQILFAPSFVSSFRIDTQPSTLRISRGAWFSRAPSAACDVGQQHREYIDVNTAFRLSFLHPGHRNGSRSSAFCWDQPFQLVGPVLHDDDTEWRGGLVG